MALGAHSIFLVGTSGYGVIPSPIAVQPSASLGLISSHDINRKRNDACEPRASAERVQPWLDAISTMNPLTLTVEPDRRASSNAWFKCGSMRTEASVSMSRYRTGWRGFDAAHSDRMQACAA